MIPNYAGCDKCLLKEYSPVHGYLGKPNKYTGMAIVGTAPTKTDILKGKPFSDRAGQLLRQTLHACGLDMDSCYVTFTTSCGLGNRADPTPGSVRKCNDRLLRELQEMQVTKILVVGGLALSAFRNPGKTSAITRLRGLGQWVDLSADYRVYLVPTYNAKDILKDEDKFRDLTADITKFLTNDAPIPRPTFTNVIPENTQDALEYLNLLSEQASFMSCDLETTGLNYFKDRITLFGFGALQADGTGFNVILRADWFEDDPEVQQAIYNLMAKWEKPLAYHNLKFDIQTYSTHCKIHGFPLPIRPPNVWDTMLMQYAQDERGAGDVGGTFGGGANYHIHGLKDQARLRWDIDPLDYVFDFEEFYAIPIEERDWENFYYYLGLDLTLTAKLYEDLLDELYEEHPPLVDLVKDTLVPGTIALAEIERTGCLIDVPYMEELSKEVYTSMRDLEIGLVQTAHNDYGITDFNPGSPTQVTSLVIGTLGVKSKTTRRDDLMVAITDPDFPTEKNVQQIVKDILAYRQYTRLYKTYILGLLERLDDDNRLRPDISLHTARTGRLAYRDPNLQNIPYFYGTEIRQGFIVPEGWSLIEFDYSQLELRIIAWESQDQDMIRAFTEGRDLHRMVGAKMFDLPEEEVSQKLRYRAKICVFGMMYGRGAKSIAEGPEMTYIREQGDEPWTIPQAQGFMDQFLNQFHGLGSWIETQHQNVLENRFVQTPLGRRRRFPLITGGGWRVQRQSVNTPTQSIASDVNFRNLTELQLEHIWKHPEEIKLILTVHDSIFFEIRKDMLSRWIPYIWEFMETTAPVDINVPLSVGCEIGQNWGQMHPVKREEVHELSEVL